MWSMQYVVFNLVRLELVGNLKCFVNGDCFFNIDAVIGVLWGVV